MSKPVIQSEGGTLAERLVSRPEGGRVITFVSAKGGTGKTVLAASTTLLLLRAGKTVLAIDGDFSTRGLSLFVLGDILHSSNLDVNREECLADYVLGNIHDISLKTMRPRRIDRGGVEYHMILSNRALWRSGVPEGAILSQTALGPTRYIERMRDLLEHFRNQYDYIIIDTRGGYDFTSAVPTLLADSYVIVLEPDKVSLEQIGGFEAAMGEFARSSEIEIPVRGFMVNKASFDPSRTSFAEDLFRTYGIKTYGIIPVDVECIRAYETKDNPVQRFPHSDFAYWCSRAVNNLIAPRIHWTDLSKVESFERQLGEI